MKENGTGWHGIQYGEVSFAVYSYIPTGTDVEDAEPEVEVRPWEPTDAGLAVVAGITDGRGIEGPLPDGHGSVFALASQY